MMYDLENIAFAYGPKAVFENLDLTFEAGHFYGIIGPNGCGKSTLIDLLAGHLRPERGCVRLNGQVLHRLDRKTIARSIAIVPQDFRINFPYTCQEIVMMGRYPYIPRFARPAEADRAIVDDVLQQADLGGFQSRYVNQLSGGERQRVVFARGLAQQTPVLLLDEATASLDMRHTMAMLNLAAGRVSPAWNLASGWSARCARIGFTWSMKNWFQGLPFDCWKGSAKSAGCFTRRSFPSTPKGWAARPTGPRTDQ